MVSVYSRGIRILGIALLLSVLFLGMIKSAYADEYGFVLKWGSYGSGDGQFNAPQGIAVDSSGNLYVTDYLNHCVQRFDGSGVFITKWGSRGSGDGQFNFPQGVAVDGAGNVYVADTANHRVQKFDGSGVFITKLGSPGSGDGQFSGPEGVAVDFGGNVYVADFNNHRVQKFRSGPVYILTITATVGGTTNQLPGRYTYAADAGALVIVSATPSANYVLDHWELDGVSVGSTNPTSVTMNADHTLHAVFMFSYSVTINDYCYDEAAAVSVAITMDGTPTGYNTPHTFTGLTVNHAFTVPNTDANSHPFQEWSTGTTSTTITVNSGGTYTAYYGTKYALTITTTTGGTTNPAPGTHAYWFGTVVGATAVPNIDYIFDHWELDGVNIGSTNPVSVTMNDDYALHAVFSYCGSYTLAIWAGSGGTTNPAPGTYTYRAGTVVGVTASPDYSHVFDHWDLDGVNVGSTSSISVAMNDNHTLIAFFRYSPPPVPELPVGDISIVTGTFAFLAAIYFARKAKKSTNSVTRHSKT